MINNFMSVAVQEGINKLGRILNKKFLASLTEEQNVQVSRNEFMECYEL